jgi:RNA polymerase sigma factor (TIGR02999 family)
MRGAGTGASHRRITVLLQAWSRGDLTARDRLIPLVYDELRQRAAHHLRNERTGHTLQPTALVHEAYLRLIEQRDVDWQSRAQFFALASQMMRRILVDHARARRAAKRPQRALQMTLVEESAAAAPRDLDLLALDESLSELSALDARQARIVELRFFGGLTQEEVADVLGLSLTTVNREWRLAKAWLYQRLAREPSS